MYKDTIVPVDEARYYKFSWREANFVPPVGTNSYVPQERGFFQVYQQGVFIGSKQYNFPATKTKLHLTPIHRCIFCERTHDKFGNILALTSEHVIPDFLGAGLELPSSSCNDCQIITSTFESTIAQEMFDAVRKSFGLIGKNGVLSKSTFPIDIGREVTDSYMMPIAHHPTILVIPSLLPASAYSSRPSNTNGMFNFIIYNINADPRKLKKYEIDGFSTPLIDTVRFCQMIAKIAHVYTTSVVGIGNFKSLLGSLIIQNIPPKTAFSSHYNYVGRLWQTEDVSTKNLHEIEVGNIIWGGRVYVAARVRLFASYGMPSFHVVVGVHRQEFASQLKWEISRQGHYL